MAINPWTTAMLVMFAADMGKELLMSRKRMGLEKTQIEAMGQQGKMQSLMGRREERRTDELMEKLAERTKSREIREDVRSAEDRQTQMAMAMLMALNNMRQSRGQIPEPGGPPASMLNFLR